MKVRWTTDSIRLRITPSELDRLRSHNEVQVNLAFPGGGRWAVRLRSGGVETGLEFQEGELVFRLSADDLSQLCEPQIEGVYFYHEKDVSGPVLRYLVEKDFPCAHPRATEVREAESESFAPPEGFMERKLSEP